MKLKISFLLLIACSTLSSCSIIDDKEEGEELQGNWKLIEINDDAVYDPFACPRETRIILKEENLIKTTYYDPAADCIEKVSTGSWEYLEDDQYAIEILPEIGQTEGRIDFESINIFNFFTRSNDKVLIFTFERI
ncbi:hypothetical protein SAMN06296241_2931 [Salinimicrobium sediminis]|uniref:Lipocalin-like domain-containing protein n=1 Tax=Salinimicrobium sediminis TaxID=1343891 RepID=A0A285X8K7_9FLAO|nr:lipocalin family protein [Salinimicrobium sediminis]SOC81356.1 hypothetical protein SAMN06296241_2931 [Salinimicrobium sediminis]